jgi:hypothetical protein
MPGSLPISGKTGKPDHGGGEMLILSKAPPVIAKTYHWVRYEK